MAYFNEEFFWFFQNLSTQNNREWFNEHKKLYERSVKAPFELFVGDVIERIQESDPDFHPEAKDCIFRIYRDTRFSNDKTPYKTYTSAVLSRSGRSHLSDPGIYLELNHEGIKVYGGSYMPAKEELAAIRETIAADIPRFNRLLNERPFLAYFGGKILGERNQRIAKHLQEAAEQQPLIYNKQFYFIGSLPAEVLSDERLPDRVMEFYEAARPLNTFFSQATGA